MKYILIPLILFSCLSEPEYLIDPELQEYHNLFLTEANRFNCNLPDKSVMMYLDTIDSNGYCTWYKNSMIIKINTEYFYSHLEIDRTNYIERTVFHELTHGYWGRHHNCNAYDSTIYYQSINDSIIAMVINVPESIMYSCDGEILGAHIYSAKRDFYLNEIFNY